MSRKIVTKDLSSAKNIQGMRIQWDREHGKLWLNQSEYIGKALEKLRMVDCKLISTPLTGYFNISKKSSLKNDNFEIVLDTSAIGSLIYATVSTRPDIAYIVGFFIGD